MTRREKPRRGRPPGGDANETRRRVVEAAVACFAASGFAGASTRQIAARAGVNVATLHYHFESKEGLYEEALALVFGEKAPPARDLAALVDALVAEGSERQARSRMSLYDLLSGPGVAPHDPRVAAVAAALPRGTSPAVAPLLVTLVDAALLATRDAGAEGRGAAGHALVREAVAAAAVALALPGVRHSPPPGPRGPAERGAHGPPPRVSPAPVGREVRPRR